jgi:RNA polymerase sigma-B factor
VTRVSDALRARTGRAPTVDAIASELSMTTADVLEALQAGRAYGAASLEAPLADDEGGTLADVIGGDDERLALVEEIATLGTLRGLLDDRDRRVLELRFVEDLTQSQIAERVGCSQMQVSRVLRRALTRLSDAVEQKPAAA